MIPTRKFLMYPCCTDYSWSNGRPVPLDSVPLDSLDLRHYRLITDPYGKRTTIELHKDGFLQRCIYDSDLMNFRKLSELEDLDVTRDKIEGGAVIRNDEDRALWMEYYRFDGDICVGAEIRSPHGSLIGVQDISYTKLGRPFNGVILRDAEAKAVTMKTYRVDEEGEFLELLEEHWDMVKVNSLTNL